jgi:hypothetical protein
MDLNKITVGMIVMVKGMGPAIVKKLPVHSRNETSIEFQAWPNGGTYWAWAIDVVGEAAPDTLKTFEADSRARGLWKE